jgi:hypothetical protein
MVAGDFNVVKSIQEKSGSCKLNSYETDFLDCKSKLCLLTSHLQAFFFFFFTWKNKRAGEEFVARKLDCVMSNEVWMERFGQIAVEFSGMRYV